MQTKNPTMARRKTDWPKIYPNKNVNDQIVSYTVDLGMQKIPGSERAKRVRFFLRA
jgi:hypothetical protein